MPTILSLPGAPFFALSFAGALLAMLGVTRMEHGRVLTLGVRGQPTRRERTRRLAVGQALAFAPAAVVGLLILTNGVTGTARLLALAGAAAAYLYFGLVVPRKPLVAAQKEAQRLRQLTPGFVSYIRVGLAGASSSLALLEQYVRRPNPRLLPMQQVVSEALGLIERHAAERPFQALRSAARARPCPALHDVVDALAQAEAEGADVLAALGELAETLEVLLKDEFSRMIQRRTIYLLGLVAVSLVVGILGNILFVMTAGGSILTGMGQ